MYKFLPSKKFISILISIIFALIIIYIFSLLGNSKAVDTKIVDLEVKTKTEEFLALDSDNDDLKDWEEALYKTDPQKADTDGDGTSDKDELVANRNPLKANTAPKGQTPNDKIDEKIIAQEKKAEQDFAKLSETDKVSRMLFSQYIANKQTGQSLTDTEITSIVNTSLSTLTPPDYKQYTLADLASYTATNTDQIKDYGNKIAQVLWDNTPSEQTDLNKIIESITEDDTIAQITERLKPMQTLADLNKSTVLKLLQIKVPTNLAATSLSFINAYAIIGDVQSQITNSYIKDPILFYSLLNSYSNYVNDLSNKFKNFRDVFVNNKINFPPDSYGYKIFML